MVAWSDDPGALIGRRAKHVVTGEMGTVVNSNQEGGVDVCWDSTPSDELNAEYFSPSARAHMLKLYAGHVQPFADPNMFDRSFDRHPNSARFHALLEAAGRLHDQKQADYGKGSDPFANVRSSEDFGVEGWVGALIRLNDKVKRLQKAAAGGELANESVYDSFMDIAVYALIAHVLYEEGHGS